MEKGHVEGFSPKNKKKKEIPKKKSKQLKKATTINPKKVKKIPKKDSCVSNKEINLQNNLHKKENSKEDTILSSLDLTLNDDHIADNYKKQNFKTYGKKIKKNNDEYKSEYKDGSSSMIHLQEL